MSNFNDADLAPRRRHWLTEPGEPLLAPLEPMRVIGRFLDFTQGAGVASSSLSMSRVGASPVPIPGSPGGGPRAFDSLDAKYAWHPLFWLPEHLTRRVMLQEADGSARTETDDEWSTRVLLSLDLAGVYEPEHGWFDVLAGAGFDIEDEATVQRVHAWLRGSEDAELSAVSLTAHLPENNYLDWSVAATGAFLDKSMPSVWAISAASLVELIADATDEQLDSRATCHQVASLARFAFRGMPSDDGIVEIFDLIALSPESIMDPDATLGSMRRDIEKILRQFEHELPQNAE